MKKMLAPVVFASILLVGCSSNRTQQLTVNVTGASAASVTIVDTTTGATLLINATVAGSQTVTVNQNDVVSVTGSNVAGYVTPAVQTVTMSSDQSVNLAYAAVTAAGTWNATVNIGGTSLSGTVILAQDGSGNLSGMATFGGVNYPVSGNVATGVLNLDLSTLYPGLSSTIKGAFTLGGYSETANILSAGTVVGTTNFTLSH